MTPPVDSSGHPIPIGTGNPPPVRVILEQGGRWARWGNWLAWTGLIICILIIIGMSNSYVSYFQTDPEVTEKYHSLSETATNKVAIITVDGAIMHSDGFVKWQIDRVRDDSAVKAVVVRVDSPGGTVTGSHYIYHHLRKLAEDKKIPLVVSMGGIAASGGYYLSMAVDKTDDAIFAEPTTWTGSIGVIIPHYDLSGLLANWKVEDDSIVSEPLKQLGSPTKEMSEEERKVLQELVNESFGQFKDVVRHGRPKINEDNLKKATTGQIFTAKQALALGLVDKIGFLEDAIDRAVALANLNKDNIRAVKYVRPKGLVDQLMLGQSEESRGLNLKAILDLATPQAYYRYGWLQPHVEIGRYDAIESIWN